MEDRFEAQFVLELSPVEAWERLVSATPGASEGQPDKWSLPGWEAWGEQLEVVPATLLRVRKLTEPCAGTEIAISFEASESGTVVTIVQSGFGAMFEAALEPLTIGWEQILADFILFMQRGVRAKRFVSSWASPGCAVRVIPAGLEVTGVAKSGAASAAGVRRGDIIVKVGGSPVLTPREFQAVVRVFRPGQLLEFTWARGNELMKASGAL